MLSKIVVLVTAVFIVCVLEVPVWRLGLQYCDFEVEELLTGWPGGTYK